MGLLYLQLGGANVILPVSNQRVTTSSAIGIRLAGILYCFLNNLSSFSGSTFRSTTLSGRLQKPVMSLLICNAA